jgi:elongation factor Ts
MEISTSQLKELRDKSGAGIMECRTALVKHEGNFEKALETLKIASLSKVAKRSQRTVGQGAVITYIHTGGKIGAMVELNCETDFVARNDIFKDLGHNIAMQIAAQEPICVSQEKMPKDCELLPAVACLLLQPYIKSPDMTIQDLINDAIAKTGENIKVNRFVRFELGNPECGIAGI